MDSINSIEFEFFLSVISSNNSIRVNNEDKSWNPSLLFFTTSRCKLSFAGALNFNSSIFF